MVAKAHSSDFAIFMRKIGYSVGLEHTLARLADFARLYAGQDSLTIGDIKRLLHEKRPIGWNLEPQNEHILNFFRSIEVLSVRGGDIGILEMGEALGIARRLQQDDSFDLTLRFLLAHALVRADGDIFLNALASHFDESEFAGRIARLVEHKWSVLEGAFRSSQQRAAIYRAVNIEIQENNPGSRSMTAAKVGPLGGAAETGNGPLGSVSGRPEIRVSSHYLANTLGRRRFWAVSLGLAEETGAITEAGQSFVDGLAAAGYGGPSCMATWPLSYELATPLFTSVQLPDHIPQLSSWDFMVLIGRSLGLLANVTAAAGDQQMDRVLSVVKCFHGLNQSRSIVRNEVPVRVAYRCLLGIAIGENAVPDYPALITSEQERPRPRLIARPSRLAELALSVRR